MRIGQHRAMRYALPAVLAFAVVLASSCAVVGNEQPAPAPNIVFIMIDDLGWMDIHPQGNELFVTPNLDRLAAQSTRFTDFYAAAPVCSPTRAACITGLAPARLQITNHIPDRWNFYDAALPAGDTSAKRVGRPWGPGRSRNDLDKRYQTIAQRLKAAGYHTGFVGKWHLAGADWQTTDTSLFPQSYGFDVNVAGNAMGGPGTFYAPIKMPNYQQGNPGEYLPDLLAQEAINYIESVQGDEQPFFLCLWTYTVHYPIEATPELYAKYTDERNEDGSVKEPDMPTRYRAMVEGMDRAIGKVLDALQAMNLDSNTLVVFTSDNGQMPGASVATPLRAGKGYLYEGGIRVPMMMRWPNRIRAGCTESSPAISMDFAPTFLAAAGVPYEREEFDGESLLALASGQQALHRDAIFLHYPHYCYHGENDMASVVRCGDLKYIHHWDNDEHELYDLASDLGEQKNLYAAEGAAVAVLRARLLAWLDATHAELPRAYDSIPAEELPGTKRSAN